MLLLLFDIPQPVSPARRTQITSTTTDNINKSKHKSLRICFEHLINLTQRCANPNMLYASTMGYGSGLGSEFNAYLLKCVLYAVITNRRFVYLNTKRKWEYNCHEQSGWSCYFGFPSCSDNIANISQINLSLTPTNNTKHFYEQPGSTYIDREEIENFDFQQESFHYFIRRLVEVYNTSLPPNICTFAEEQIFYPAEVAGPISKHLFHLNNKTSHAVKVINHKYEHIARKPYIGMLMRLTDKSGEMPKEDWEMLSNMSFIADRLITAWHNHTIKFNLGTNVLHDVYVGKFTN